MPTQNIKPPIYLLDTMAFIFRAYHAMQRSRPMTTRTGIPTAATYVFVNMINKLRADFKPEFLAAVFDADNSCLNPSQLHVRVCFSITHPALPGARCATPATEHVKANTTPEKNIDRFITYPLCTI